EYDEAKNEQAKVEAQISELEEMIANIKVIGDHEIQTDTVSIGVSVKVLDMEYDEEVEYTLVSSREVNPLENKISDQSPIGKAIIGAKIGDVVTVEVPDGKIKVKVLEIKKNDNQ
ncbi:MAG: transcription elongation factor GreA, partial [Clostridiales bacterium]|nr:transcription elongation factor GreA [Clostridiales bacterium]